MDNYKKIAISTGEDSLNNLHKKIIHLLEQESPVVKSLIEQLMDYYQKIILCMPGNVYWMDKDCKTVGCNQKVLEMFGLTNLPDFEDLSFDEMAQIGSWTEEQGMSFKKDTMEVISSGQPKMNVEEPPIPDTEGNLLYFLSSRMPIFNEVGKVIGIVGISTDITHQKITEQALSKANKVKSEFLANLSHDIRTPLSSIVALTETLNNRSENPEFKELAFDAQTCAEEVLMLIDEILEITEIDLGHIQKEEQAFDLKTLIESIKVLMFSSAKQKNLAITISLDSNIPDALFGRRQLLHRILLNLLSNAIKFTAEGFIKIEASVTHNNNENIKLKITVEDSGIGISGTNQERIFEQFERVNSTYNNKYEGRGLGLYIVKQFVSLMEGTISVESEEKKGSKFTIEIPLKIATATQKKHRVMEPSTIARRAKMHAQLNDSSTSKISREITCPESKNNLKVLLIEDTPIARKAALATLAALACMVEIAQTGKEAIDKACSNTYDIILLDIGLPDISGLDVAKYIREHEAKNNLVPTPIIALTAHVAQSAIQQCINSGIQQIIRKPLTATRANALFKNWQPDIYCEGTTSKPQVPNEKFQTELFKKFLEELPSCKNKIVLAHKKNERSSLKETVHIVHGSARYLNLVELQKTCNSLESAITDEFSDAEIDSLYFDLIKDIEDLLLLEQLS